MKTTILAACAAASLLTACVNQSGPRTGLFSATAPAVAILHDDLFVGEATTYLNRTGRIDVRSTVDQDVRCVGDFTYTGATNGSGIMYCDGGVEARFSFNALSSLSGYGYGKTSRGRSSLLSFTYGLTADEAAGYLNLPQGSTLKEKDNGQIVLTPHTSTAN
jgi:hypothetical protein